MGQGVSWKKKKKKKSFCTLKTRHGGGNFGSFPAIKMFRRGLRGQ